MSIDTAVLQTFPGLLDHAAALNGDRLAIRTSARDWTYREVHAAAAELASALIELGVGKGSRVAIWAGNSPFFIVSLFACAQLGALSIPVSTLATPAELITILRHSDAQLLIAERKYLRRDSVDLITASLPDLAQVAANRPLHMPQVPYLRSIWLESAEGVAWAGDLAGLVSQVGENSARSELLAAIKSQVVPSDAGVIIYTSGSTALPKAVVHGQGTMIRHAVTLAGYHFLKPNEAVVCMTPMFWVGGLGILLETFANGGTIVLPDGVAAKDVLEALKRFSVDFVYAWPVQRSAVRDLAAAGGVDVDGVRGISPDRAQDGNLLPLERRPNALGMTESFGPHCLSRTGSMLPTGREGAFGLPVPGIDRRVLDPETGIPVPLGQVGELQLRGGALMQGYYKKENSEVFLADGYFATSDLVRIDDEGYLFFAGRSGDVLKTRGANVSRLEVEAALKSIKGVAEVVVVGLNDEEMGQRIVAGVVPATGAKLTEIGVREGLLKTLSSYKVPSNIVFISHDEILWTPTGKVKLADMATMLSDRLDLSAE